MYGEDLSSSGAGAQGGGYQEYASGGYSDYGNKQNKMRFVQFFYLIKHSKRLFHLGSNQEYSGQASGGSRGDESGGGYRSGGGGSSGGGYRR